MRAKVTFRQVIQDSQDYGSDDQHMVSRIFFDLDIAGQHHEGLHVDVKQTVGSDYETSPLEMGAPHGYRGPFNHEAFREAAEKYYHSQVGSSASGIRIAPGAKVRMRNNRFVATAVVEFDVIQQGGFVC